jgi:hypothetical protein
LASAHEAVSVGTGSELAAVHARLFEVLVRVVEHDPDLGRKFCARFLDSADTETRKAGAEALRNLSTREPAAAVPLLEVAMCDPDESVCSIARDSLERALDELATGEEDALDWLTRSWPLLQLNARAPAEGAEGRSERAKDDDREPV